MKLYRHSLSETQGTIHYSLIGLANVDITSSKEDLKLMPFSSLVTVK